MLETQNTRNKTSKPATRRRAEKAAGGIARIRRATTGPTLDAGDVGLPAPSGRERDLFGNTPEPEERVSSSGVFAWEAHMSSSDYM